jgi:predicted nucleotidyltransferase
MKDKNKFGSIEVMTKEEVAIMVQVLSEDTEDPAEIMMEIKFIDDLLSIQKRATIFNNLGRRTAKGFMRKDFKNYLYVIEGRIGVHIEELKQAGCWKPEPITDEKA